MKELTVMVSLYNSGEWIENRLNNLCASISINNLDIWCVNANSPDERDDIIPQKFPVTYIKLQERLGVYATWNYIIKNSNSKYLTNANSDDLISPDGYNKLVNILNERHKCGFVYPSWFTTSTPNLTWEQAKSNLASPDGLPGNYIGDLGHGGVGHFPVWRRSLHNSLGLFDERFKALGDADWWARCYHLNKCEFRWFNEFLACYLWRDGQNLWHTAINQDEWDLYHRKVEQYKIQRK